jgi:hypothetical protein
VTRIVNIRTGSYDVYIGRPGRGRNGIFGNPYPVWVKCVRCGELHTTPASTLPCFRAYFEERVRTDDTFRLHTLRLRGKTLGCYCKPGNPCHGKVIVEWLDQQETEAQERA